MASDWSDVRGHQALKCHTSPGEEVDHKSECQGECWSIEVSLALGDPPRPQLHTDVVSQEAYLVYFHMN